MAYKKEKHSKVDPNKQRLVTGFEEILFNCEQIFNADRKDLFDFLDPVVSDSQCQIHSMFIISKLQPLRDTGGTVDLKNIKNLPDKDRRLLSYVVLLSLLKYEEVDEVGFSKIKQLMDYVGIFFGQVTAERRIINQLKTAFSSHSIEYLKDVTGWKLKQVLEECDARLRHKTLKLQLQLQPCYVSFYTLFRYMEAKQLPIIVPFVRFNAETSQFDSKLRSNSKGLLYFHFLKSKNEFIFKSKKDLSEEEKLHPTIVISCFSIINNNYPEHFEEYMEGSQLPSDKFLTEDCDIRELLLLSAAGHVQLTVRNDHKDPKYTDDDMKQLFKRHSNLSLQPKATPFTGNFDLIEDNVYGCYEHHYNVAEKFGIVNARFAYRSKCVDDPNATTESPYSLIRRNENTFFKFDHVYVSTYDRECNRLNSKNVGAEVPLIESENFCKTKAQTSVESKWSEVQSYNLTN